MCSPWTSFRVRAGCPFIVGARCPCGAGCVGIAGPGYAGGGSRGALSLRHFFACDGPALQALLPVWEGACRKGGRSLIWKYSTWGACFTISGWSEFSRARMISKRLERARRAGF